MRLHEREPLVNSAETRLRGAIDEVIYDEELALTEGEVLKLMTNVFSSVLSHMARHKIRMERHGDPNKEGGLAFD